MMRVLVAAYGVMSPSRDLKCPSTVAASSAAMLRSRTMRVMKRSSVGASCPEP